MKTKKAPDSGAFLVTLFWNYLMLKAFFTFSS
jgi:hypothetical protein